MYCNLKILSIFAFVLTIATAGPAGAAGNPDRGKNEFRRCASCHSAEPNVHKTGPSLAAIWGQKAGTVDGFTRYSEALKQSQVVWDRDTLDVWLRDPQDFIPGNRMTMRGLPDVGSRQDIIAYLEHLAAQNAQSQGSEGSGAEIPARQKNRRDLPDLKLLGPGHHVRAIRYCNDTYFVTTDTGEAILFWEFNLRFKTDSTDRGPSKGQPVLLPASMQGDRAFVIFADPAEISPFIESSC